MIDGWLSVPLCNLTVVNSSRPSVCLSVRLSVRLSVGPHFSYLRVFFLPYLILALVVILTFSRKSVTVKEEFWCRFQLSHCILSPTDNKLYNISGSFHVFYHCNFQLNDFTKYVPQTSFLPNPIQSLPTFQLNVTSSRLEQLIWLKILVLFPRQNLRLVFKLQQSFSNNILIKTFLSFN